MWLPLHATGKVFKVNDTITSLIYGYLSEHLTIQNGIPSELRTVAIILGYLNIYYNKLKITLGSYAQFCIITINRTNKRTVGPMAMHQENEQVGRYSMLLVTGKKLHTYIWR